MTRIAHHLHNQKVTLPSLPAQCEFIGLLGAGIKLKFSLKLKPFNSETIRNHKNAAERHCSRS